MMRARSRYPEAILLRSDSGLITLGSAPRCPVARGSACCCGQRGAARHRPNGRRPLCATTRACGSRVGQIRTWHASQPHADQFAFKLLSKMRQRRMIGCPGQHCGDARMDVGTGNCSRAWHGGSPAPASSAGDGCLCGAGKKFEPGLRTRLTPENRFTAGNGTGCRDNCPCPPYPDPGERTRAFALRAHRS